MAHEHHTLRRDRLPTITTGNVGLLADTQEILPHHNDMVGEIRKTYATTFIWEGNMRRRDRRTMENFYYEVIRNLLRAPTDHATKATTLKQMKAKITRLHHEEQKVYSVTMPNATE